MMKIRAREANRLLGPNGQGWFGFIPRRSDRFVIIEPYAAALGMISILVPVLCFLF
jgi:hypothetical protein